MLKKITEEEHQNLMSTFLQTPITFPIQPLEVMVYPDDKLIVIDPTLEKIQIVKDTDIRLEVAQNIMVPWFGGIDHFLKTHWNSKHKIKGSRIFKTATKPKGLVIKSLWELCKEVNALSSNARISTGTWFARCLYDLIEIKIEETLTNPLECVSNNNHKKAIADRDTKLINQLRDLQNPFAAYPKAVGLNRLIADSIERAHESDQFTAQYWKPFLTALRVDVTEQQSERWGWTRLQNGSLCVHIGRGRPKKQKILKNVN